VKVKEHTMNLGIGVMWGQESLKSFPTNIYHSYCFGTPNWKDLAATTRKKKNNFERVTVAVLVDAMHLHYFVDGQYAHSKELLLSPFAPDDEKSELFPAVLCHADESPDVRFLLLPKVPTFPTLLNEK
jgi:hypothetical protein